MDLQKLVADIDKEMLAPECEYQCPYDMPYYRAFIAYCRLHKPKRVLELGTHLGWSAVALAKYAGHVDTYDVKDKDAPVPGNVSKHILKTPEDVLSLPFADYDLIIVDIDHSGMLEIFLHDIFKESYKGLVIWDDIDTDKCPGMRVLWDYIDVPKIKTDWHPKHGQGVSLYG